MSTSSVTTFDSFNRYILKGDSADRLELLFDSLMQRAWDEPDAMYGLVARAAEVAADKKSVTFWMRPEARFADGTKVTSADVVFSFKVIKEKGHPLFRIQLRDVVGAEALAPLVVKYTFKGTEIRDLPLIVAGLPIFSKAYYSRVDFAKTSLKPPLGSGPYRIGKFKQGSYVTYRRRPDYWAKALNVNRGRYNFDAVRIEYFRDRNAGMESFKAGVYDLREEFTSRVWATGYDFPAVRDGRVKLAVLPDRSPSGAQGFFINIRREKFKDVRVRKALGLAFDFSWTNRNMFYGLYKRTESYFENSALKAKGIASASEQAILSSAVQPGDTTSRYKIAPVPAKSNGTGRDRRLLHQAYNILGRAGLALPKAGAVPQACGFGCRALKLVGFSGPPAATVLRDGKGRPFNFEFLLQDPDFERIINPYLANLRALGINAWVRVVDAAQYQRRLKSFDFDIVSIRYTMRLTPGAELLNYFSSRAADIKGSRNLAGIKSPVIDKLISAVMKAQSRNDLTMATRALDRVLRAGHYWVPHWYKASHTIAHWNKFSRPKIKPDYHRGIVDTWWYDAKKANALKGK